MKTIKAVMIVATLSYTLGDSPWCMVDNYGNMKCYYYTYDSCMNNCQMSAGTCVKCETNPNGQ